MVRKGFGREVAMRWKTEPVQNSPNQLGVKLIVQPLLPPYLLSCHLPGFVQEEMIVFVHGQLFSELGEASCYLPNFHHSALFSSLICLICLHRNFCTVNEMLHHILTLHTKTAENYSKENDNHLKGV